MIQQLDKPYAIRQNSYNSCHCRNSRVLRQSAVSILAANEDRPAEETASEESSSKYGEKPDVTPDAEGFYGDSRRLYKAHDGYVNLRKDKDADSPIIAKVKKDELFEYQCTQNATWCKVKLASGVTGWKYFSPELTSY